MFQCFWIWRKHFTISGWTRKKDPEGFASWGGWSSLYQTYLSGFIRWTSPQENHSVDKQHDKTYCMLWHLTYRFLLFAWSLQADGDVWKKMVCLQIFAWMTLCSEGIWKVFTCLETNGSGANGRIDCFSIGEPAASQIRCFQQLYLSSKRRALSGWRSLNNTSHRLDSIWVNCRRCGGLAVN